MRIRTQARQDGFEPDHEQLQALMVGAMATALQQVQHLGLHGGGQERVGAAAAESLQPCLLGRDTDENTDTGGRMGLSLTQQQQTRETSKANAVAMRGLAAGTECNQKS